MNNFQKLIVWIVFAGGAVATFKTGNAWLMPVVLAVCIGLAAVMQIALNKRREAKE